MQIIILKKLNKQKGGKRKSYFGGKKQQLFGEFYKKKLKIAQI